MIVFVVVSSTLLMLAFSVNGQGYGRQGFGAAGGGENYGNFNSPPPFSGRGYRHRTSFDSFGNNGQNSGGFIPQQPIHNGGFDPQSSDNNFQGSSSSWSHSPNTNTQFGQGAQTPDSHFDQNGAFQTPNTHFGQNGGVQTTNTDFSSSNPRQFEAPNQSPPQVEVQPGSSSSSSTNNHPSETANEDIDTTGARTFGKSSSADVAVAEADTAAPSIDAVPTLPPTDRSLAVDLPQGAGSNSGQSGAQSPPTSAVDPNSSKLIPEPPVLG